MSRTLFFTTVCPNCKRRSQLEMQMLGKQTKCASCCGSFEAVSPDSCSAALFDPINYWIRFTEHGMLNSESSQDFDTNPIESEFEDWDIGRNPR